MARLEMENETILPKQLNNTLIISGSDINKALLNVTAEIPHYKKIQTATEHILTNTLKLDGNDFAIFNARRLGRTTTNKHSPDKRSIVLDVDDQISKNHIMTAVLKMKPNSLFINEFLTHRRRANLQTLLELRKKNKDAFIQVYSVNGVLYVKTERNERALQINTTDDIEAVIAYLTGAAPTDIHATRRQ